MINRDMIAGVKENGGEVLLEPLVKKKDFVMNKDAIKSLDLYIEKLEKYYDEIGLEKEDNISKKSKILETVLRGERMNIE